MPTPNEDVDPSAIVGQAAVVADDRHVLFLGDTHVSWSVRVWDAVTGLITDQGRSSRGRPPRGGSCRVASRMERRRRRTSGQWSRGGAHHRVPAWMAQPTLETLGYSAPVRRGAGRRRAAGRPARGAVRSADAYALVTMFDPRSGAASDKDLPIPPGMGRIVGLADGRVLVASGRGTTHLDVLDPDTFAATDAGVVTTPEFGADTRPGTAEITMTLLGDGRVLILGGTDASVWDPRTGSATVIPGPQAPATATPRPFSTTVACSSPAARPGPPTERADPAERRDLRPERDPLDPAGGRSNVEGTEVTRRPTASRRAMQRPDIDGS